MADAPTSDKLSEIMAFKRHEIAGIIRPVRDRELQRLADIRHDGPGFRQSLKNAEGLAIIAEIKRRSPSAGQIAELPDATEQARLYHNAEVNAISVLTDTKYFGGTLRDLWEVTDFLSVHRRAIPCLRKDFMVHPIQIIEAAEAGARAILIIVRALNDEEIRILNEGAQMAGLDVLFEIHTEAELERALRHQPTMIGVNNRDLARFEVDLAYSEALIPLIPKDILAVSESGIHTVEDAARARACGAKAVLVGQALMTCEDPEEQVRLFRSA